MSSTRRYDFDWLRIAAFATLILYHIGMFYVTWDWHVKSSRASEAIEPLMQFFNPWRLLLLFLISGAATRFMADKMKAGALGKARVGRLLPPLLLAIFVIVPPQAYYEIVEALRAIGAPQSPWLDDFYLKYVTASGNWCDADGCLITPTYNHMWFVLYLLIYSLLLIPLLPLLRRIPKGIAVLIAGPGLLVAPWLFLFAARATLFPIFDTTHALVDDWYMHVVSFGAFLFGFAIAKHDTFFEACARWRLPALALTCAAWAGLMLFYNAYAVAEPPETLRLAFRGVRELQAWTGIVAAVGFAHHYLRTADGPVRRYFTAGIFPFYLLHQTIIVVAGHYLDPLRLTLALEAALLIAITLAGCFAGYELARRIGPLRIWFGLPSKPNDFRGKNPEFATGGT